MSAKIIDGRAVAARVKEELKAQIEELKAKGILPGLAVIIVGNNPASRIYVNIKKKVCEELGVKLEEYALDEKVSQSELMELIKTLNSRKDIHGILAQQPLPSHLDTNEAIWAIDPMKDVDASHPINAGKLLIGNPDFIPCTPAGIIELIKEAGIELAGKECVVVGRSNIVGKPMAALFLLNDGTVTICHSKTKNLAEVCKRADILVAAVGKAGLIKADMVKPGAVVIDVGVTRVEGKKIVGDVDFEDVVNIAGAITPAVGGVGPMTVAMLMKNTVKAAQLTLKK